MLSSSVSQVTNTKPTRQDCGFFCLRFTGKLNASLRSHSCQDRGSQAANCKPFALPLFHGWSLISFGAQIQISPYQRGLFLTILSEIAFHQHHSGSPRPCCIFLHGIHHCLTYSVSFVYFVSLTKLSKLHSEGRAFVHCCSCSFKVRLLNKWTNEQTAFRLGSGSSGSTRSQRLLFFHMYP